MTAPKRRWFRFSLRTLFVVVTILAICTGLWMRTRRLDGVARFHEQQLLEASSPYFMISDEERTSIGETRWRQLVVECDAIGQWHQAMFLKYRRAIWRPWVQLETDPTRPKEPEPIVQAATGS